MGTTASQRAATGLRHALSVALVACWPFTASSAAPNKPAGCLIEPEQVADVGSPVTGVIESLPVALGDAVVVGQPVVTLRADVERANAQVAQLRSQVDADAKAAKANLVLAQQKVARARQLLAQNFVSTQAVDQAVAEAEVADQKYKLARSQQQIYVQEQNVAKAQLGLRTLRSPISGIVVERYNNLGERVEDRPVIRVASINPLRVSLMIPITQYGQIKVGDAMTIRPELPGMPPLNATVRYVDQVVDAASNTFRVRLSLPNPDHRLPGGLRCKADIQTASGQAPAAVKPAMAPMAAPVKSVPVTTTWLTPAMQLANPVPVPVGMATRHANTAPPMGLALKTSFQLQTLPARKTSHRRSSPRTRSHQGRQSPSLYTMSSSLRVSSADQARSAATPLAQAASTPIWLTASISLNASR